MASSALIGLAWLKVNWDKDQTTYLDNFVPLVCEVIQNELPEAVTTDLVCDRFENRFGLDIPHHAADELIDRTYKRGYLNLRNRTYTPDPEELQKLDLERERRRVEGIHDGIVDELLKYCHEELRRDWNKHEAESALQSYLEDYDLEIMLSDRNQTALPEPSDGSTRSNIVVSSFLAYLFDNKPGVFDLFTAVVQGHMLANALFVTDPSNPEERLDECMFLFDGPLLTYAAGYGPEYRVVPLQELLDLLDELGGEAAYLRPSLEEARGGLNACATIIEKGAYSDSYGPVREMIDHFYSANKTSSDIRQYEATLGSKLRANGVVPKEIPAVDREYEIDQPGLTKHLWESVSYSHRRQVDHDVRAVAAVNRFRKGLSRFAIEDCEAIFVTDNSGLVHYTENYLADDKQDGEAPHLITERRLTNVVWLKKPIEAPDLPAKQLISYCRAALQPSDELWKTFLGEVESLRESGGVDEEEYVLLRHSLEAKAALMEITEGDVDRISSGRVEEVLNRAWTKHERELQNDLEREKQLRTEAQKRAESRRKATASRLDGISSRIAWWVSRGLGVGIGVVLVVATVLAFPWDLPAVRSAIPNYLGTGLLIVLLGIYIGDHFVGSTVRKGIEVLEGMTYRFLRRKLFDYFNIGKH